MLSNRQEHPDLPLSAATLELGLEASFKEVSLFLSLCLAELMVWRALRRQTRERATRLKRIRLVLSPTTASSNNAFDAHHSNVSEVWSTITSDS